jgi:hypothetical protein
VGYAKKWKFSSNVSSQVWNFCEEEKEREGVGGWVWESERGYAQCVTVLIAHKVYMESSFSWRKTFFFSLKKRKFLGVRTFFHYDDSRMSVRAVLCVIRVRNNLNCILYMIIAFENVDFTPPHFMCFCPLSFRSSIHAISFTYNFRNWKFYLLPSQFSLSLSVSLSLSRSLSLFSFFQKNTEAPVLLDELVVESRGEKFTFQSEIIFSSIGRKSLFIWCVCVFIKIIF